MARIFPPPFCNFKGVRPLPPPHPYGTGAAAVLCLLPPPPCVISLCASQTNVYRTTEGGEGRICFRLTPYAHRFPRLSPGKKTRTSGGSIRLNLPIHFLLSPPPEKAEGRGGEKLRRNFPSQLYATLVGKDGLCLF